jgi:hypothetical protein
VSIFDKIGHSAQSAVQKLHVRSALNPMLWLCGIISPLSFTFAYLFKDSEAMRNIFVAVGFVPVGITCIGFLGFAIFRPEKLQSEDYQIRHESLQIIQQKVGQLEIDSTSLEAIANPNVPQLPSGRGE